MTDEVRKELLKKKEDLYRFCLANKIPAFMVFANETDSETKYEHLCVTPETLGVTLKDDKITKYCASLNQNFELRFKSFVKTESEIEDAYDSLLEDD